MAKIKFSDIKKIKGISGNEKILLDEILFRTQIEGYCWMSNKKLAEIVDVSVRSIQRYLKKMKKLGLILVEEIRNKETKQFEIRKIFVLVDNFSKHLSDNKSTKNKSKSDTKQADKPAVEEQKIEEPKPLDEHIVEDDTFIDPVTGEVFDIKPKQTVSLLVEVMLKKRFGIELTKEITESILKLENKYDVDEFAFAVNNSWDIKVDRPIPYLAASLKRNRQNGSYAAYKAEEERKAQVELARENSPKIPEEYYNENWIHEDLNLENLSDNNDVVLAQDEVVAKEDDYQTAISYSAPVEKQSKISELAAALGLPKWNQNKAF